MAEPDEKDVPVQTADPELVTMMAGYRVGFGPPAPDSLAPGEMYLQMTMPDAPGPPTLWVGVPQYVGSEGNIFSVITGAPPAKASSSKK